MSSKSLIRIGLGVLASCVVFSNSAFAECSADDQGTYDSCIDSAATTCAASVPGCNSTLISTTNSADIVERVITKCCAKATARAQKSCGTAQRVRLTLGLTVIPTTYVEFKRVARAAIKELKALIKAGALCETGSN